MHLIILFLYSVSTSADQDTNICLFADNAKKLITHKAVEEKQIMTGKCIILLDYIYIYIYSNTLLM